MIVEMQEYPDKFRKAENNLKNFYEMMERLAPYLKRPSLYLPHKREEWQFSNPRSFIYG